MRRSFILQKIMEMGMGIVMVLVSAILLNYYGEHAAILQGGASVNEVYYENQVDIVNHENQKNSENQVENVDTGEFCVVLDAGHGGDDPGKIGVNNALEKDINLSIVYFLKENLEASDVKVVLTRETDAGLYESSANNKKIDDMNKRCAIINQTQPNLVVSIHQNSYHEEAVKGPQLFYYKTSEEGKRAAQLLQRRFDTIIGAENNTRVAKSNDNYYLLLHTEVPIVICECGFLSNWEEAEKLVTEEYQKQVSWTVFMGIMQYLNGKQ